METSSELLQLGGRGWFRFMASCFVMNRFHLFLCVFFVLFCGAGFAASDRPNILVILADDLGYGDVQCYNPERGKIPTPHIDKLAAEGMRFTDGHSSSGVCTPS